MTHLPIESIPRVTGVEIKEIRIEEPFPDFAATFAQNPGSVVLLSGGDQDSARYHLLATRPWLSIRSKNRECTLQSGKKTWKASGDPFDLVRRILNQNRLQVPGSSLPIAAGLFGYFSYDLKDHLEDLKKTCVDDLLLPDLYLIAPTILVLQEIQTQRSYLCLPRRESQSPKDLEEIRRAFSGQRTGRAKDTARSGPLRSNFSKPDYIRAVETIRDYIRQGHVYQVNLSQRFSLDYQGSGYELFVQLFASNPAPFFAYVNPGDHEIISTSPERFLRRSGQEVETRPIKGTRPRGGSNREDQDLKLELQNSPKDRAELSMIVDLLRNDLGKVCAPSTVRVVEHLRVEAYKNVFHLVSIVKGRLAPDQDSLDLIRGAFPGGSITGCPKVRAMEIIDEMETNQRHIYTGSIGYLSFHDSLDLSIAIRTATLVNQKIVFSVGGGIVFDSDPVAEYHETLHKGQTLMQSFQGSADTEKNPAKIWCDGLITTEQEARVAATAPGLQYGFGLFETIRVDQGKPRYLQEHLQRLQHSWTRLSRTPFPDLSFDEIMARTIFANQLEQSTAAVKILISKGKRDKPPLDHTLLVSARPYRHRLAGLDRSGFLLKTYPHPRHTFLAEHKTCNYLFYVLAKEWAAEQGVDEALILNPDGSWSETNTANLLIVRGKTVVIPASAHVLPGIMQEQVRRNLSRRGYRCESGKVFTEDLGSEDRVLVSNSLLGAVGVSRIDDRAFADCSQLAGDINQELLCFDEP